MKSYKNVHTLRYTDAEDVASDLNDMWVENYEADAFKGVLESIEECEDVIRFANREYVLPYEYLIDVVEELCERRDAFVNSDNEDERIRIELKELNDERIRTIYWLVYHFNERVYPKVTLSCGKEVYLLQRINDKAKVMDGLEIYTINTNEVKEK